MTSFAWLCLMTLQLVTQIYSQNSNDEYNGPAKNAIILTRRDKEYVVLRHNEVRSDVTPTSSNMMIIACDDELAETAQQYSRNCVYEHSQGIITSKFNKIGENLYISSNEVTPKNVLNEAIKNWEEEMKDYNISSNECTNVCGHYTQLVWNSTYAVGCGLTTCPNIQVGNEQWSLAQLVVCQYGPAGNFNNKRPYQVGKPCSACPSDYSCKNNLCSRAAKLGSCHNFVVLLLLLSFKFTVC